MSTPSPRAILELFKPITWFAPMWAFACGAVSSAQPMAGRWGEVVAGVVLSGPLLVATSQAVNDWYDRHVDAINEPQRPIPSGRIPGRWGLYIAIFWTLVSLAVAFALGPWVFGAALLGVVLAWIYSAPPLRLKRNGWWGNAAVGLSYEGLAWFAGAAVLLNGLPPAPILQLALLYSLGAHGIMTLNDFKSVEGDLQMGLASLPAQLGVDRAAQVACWVMTLPQLVVIGLLLHWGTVGYATLVVLLLLAQWALMLRLLEQPRARAPWYNATGTSLYVWGMLVSALALRSLGGGL
jgi:chlorophyll synthase